jgi:hypothetical protein
MRAKGQARERLAESYDRAVDYLENRQLDDVESQLSRRYERTQAGRRGQTITAQAVPLTQRFADEAATLYARKVERKVVNPEGEVNETLTEQVNKLLSDSYFDQCMESLERRLVLLKSAGLWFQPRRGRLKTKIALPQDIYPVAPEDRDFFDASDQADYEAFVVETARQDDSGSAQKRKFAYTAPAGTVFYRATEPFGVAEGFTEHDNPIAWPQVIDTDDGRGRAKTLPLQMLGLWHLARPSDELIIDTDVPVVDANRELNLQLSVILDTIAHQGWAIPVYHALNPDTAPATMSAGPRFGLTVGVEETLEMLTSAVSYTDILGALESFVKLVAIFESMSPNDFALTGVLPQSGFAKLIDNLPKIEKRQRAAERMARIEADIAWPRIAASGYHIGALDGTLEQLAQHKLVTSFEDIQFPESPSERIQRQSHEIEHGITSAARILAKRDGISLEEAQEIGATSRRPSRESHQEA